MLKSSECKNFKPREKPYKKSDSGGMYLLINPNGSKYWRLKYRYKGKEKKIALGVYPKVSLKEARRKREEYKLEIEKGIDPTFERKCKKQGKQEASFKSIALAWYKWHWRGIETKEARNTLSRLKRHVFAFLGEIAINEITPQDLINVIGKIEDRGILAEAAKTRGIIGQIFKYAVVTRQVERNLITEINGMYRKSPSKNHPYLEEKEFKLFLQSFDNFKLPTCTKLALKFLVLTFVRSGEARGARWEEFDFEKNEWHIPAERMKAREQHIVPLSKQALEVLKEAKEYFYDGELVFHSLRNPSKEMSDNTLSKALRDQGYQGKATPHGMRATASTILNENGFRPDVIERQLAHCEHNGVRAAYNHAQYLQERRKMMDWWGDYVGKAEAGKSQ